MKSLCRQHYKMLQKVLTLVIFFCVAVSGGRMKRHLVFSEGSRLFFSVDLRDNLFNYSDFFAHVFGFKIDFDLPSSVVHISNKGRIQRRDLYQGIELLLYHQKLNGTFCIEKFLCEASNLLPKYNHFLAQLYEVIFSTGIGFKNSDREECLKMLTIDECPLSLSFHFYYLYHLGSKYRWFRVGSAFLNFLVRQELPFIPLLLVVLLFVASNRENKVIAHFDYPLRIVPEKVLKYLMNYRGNNPFHLVKWTVL